MKKCKKCNMTFDDSVAFCPVCGGKLDEPVSNLKEEKEYKETPLPPEKIKGFVIKRNIVLYLGSAVAILPFFITGFSFFFTWYILIAIVALILLFCLWAGEKTEENMTFMNFALSVLLIIAFLMYRWGPLNPDY